MAEDLITLQAQLAKLRLVRGFGTEELVDGNRRVKYRADAQLATAIADLERRIAALSTPVRTIHITSGSRGLS